jgi:hypothetical protein
VWLALKIVLRVKKIAKLLALTQSALISAVRYAICARNFAKINALTHLALGCATSRAIGNLAISHVMRN